MSKKPHPIDAHIGSRCKEARNEAKLRLEDVGDKLKLSHMAISHYESGSTRLSWATLIKLGQLYDKKLHWFLEGAPGF